jgi:hypothetical protein
MTDRVVLKECPIRQLAIPPFSPAPEDRREHPSAEMLEIEPPQMCIVRLGSVSRYRK